MKSINCYKPGYTSITGTNIEHISYNLIFTTKCNDSLILFTIIILRLSGITNVTPGQSAVFTSN